MDPEKNVYEGVYKVLLAGMILSTVFFAAGVILALIHPAFVPLDAQWVLDHYHWSVELKGLASGDPAAYMMLGTVVLILTPVLRVIVSIHSFFVDRDYKYVVITSIVLLVIIATIILSRFGLK